ncbi:MAG: aspartate aminotransferase family protein [Cyanosarcina radialis HA8281-LM2]|jgi:glutamate-1-semialdehyde-2,1-aminomutase|nr:aspartate aminotransferase family protein [Cyanosarcina radialis HA8281-LM2]
MLETKAGNLSESAPHTLVASERDRQSEYLAQSIARHTEKTKISKQIAQKYRPVLADKRTLVDFLLPFKEIYYPIVTKRSFGAKIWDVDGNEYIDLIMGFGVNLFGHNPIWIRQVLQEQLETGIELGLQPELVGEVAQMICDLTGMERVTFTNTGTEAVMTAIRLARAVTNRQKIAIFTDSYHGHFDGILGQLEKSDRSWKTIPTTIGISPNYVADLVILDYGNFESLEIVKKYKHELAAVLVEPVQSRRIDLQPKEFLQQLRQLTKELDIALIFDELVTGFRIHPGGAQAWFGVEADIATYGKILGGGMPIAVIAGKAAYMDKIDGGVWNYGDDSFPSSEKIFFAGTFCKHPLAIAAAHTILQHFKERGSTVQEELNQRTTQFVQTLNTYFESQELPIQLANFGSIFGPASVSIAEDEKFLEEESAINGFDLLYYHLLNRGIMLRGDRGFLSTAHTDEDLDRIISAVQDSINELIEGGFFS